MYMQQKFALKIAVDATEQTGEEDAAEPGFEREQR